MISPVTVIVRGIQMLWLTDRMIRSAMLVLPLPGWPYRNRPRPAYTAWPIWLIVVGREDQVGKSPAQVGQLRTGLADRLPFDEAIYSRSGTGAAPQ